MFYLISFGLGYFFGKGGSVASVLPGSVLNTQPAGTPLLTPTSNPSTTPTYNLPAGYRVDANGNVYNPAGQIVSASALTQFLKSV